MPKGKKNVGTAPAARRSFGRSVFPGTRSNNRPKDARRPAAGPAPLRRASERNTSTPEARPTKLRHSGAQGAVRPIKSAPQPYESDCGAHGAPSEEEKSFGLRGGCKDGCGGENSRDGCWAGRGESKPAGNQRPEAAAAGACPDAGAAGVSSAAVASCPAARSSAAVGASKRGTPSM